jgi:hypothetical protein
MIEWLKNLWKRFVEWTWGKIDETDPPPPLPMPLPFYIAEMRKTHPGLSDEELKETVDLEAKEDTTFYISQMKHDGSYLRNEKGRLILKPMAGEKIPAGTLVEVYRWAFPVDGGAVRESRWHITDSKGLVDVRKFSTPE